MASSPSAASGRGVARALALLAIAAAPTRLARAFVATSPPAPGASNTFGAFGALSRRVAPSPLVAAKAGSAGSAGSAGVSALAAGLLGGLATAVAAAAGAIKGERGSRVACAFKKRYGGGHGVKKDYFAVPELGPQFVGPGPNYGIQRRSRLGFPKSGDQRVIPKLSGGSYDRRKQMMRSLTTEIIRHGRIKTTRARAEAAQSFVDRMVVIARRGDDLSLREAMEWMFDEKLVDNLFKLAPERYPDLSQKSGFTQVTRTMNRKGDWAEMAYIELI